MSIQDCENWLHDGADTEDGRIVNGIVQQLADIMRENAELREIGEGMVTSLKSVNKENERFREALKAIAEAKSPTGSHLEFATRSEMRDYAVNALLQRDEHAEPKACPECGGKNGSHDYGKCVFLGQR